MTWTRLWRLLCLALRSFRRYRLQSVLAIVAAASGTGGILSTSGYAAAGREKILDQFRRMGTNIIVVTPRMSRAAGGRARTGSIVTTLRDSDYRAILQAVPQITASSPTVSATVRLRAGDLTKSTTLVGCMPDFFPMRSWELRDGSAFDSTDERAGRRVALLGATVARDLFSGADPVGNRLLIGSVPFTVTGVLSERGQGVDAANEDAQVYVPLSTAMRRILNQDYYASILIEIGSWQAMDSAAAEIQDVLSRRHRFFSFGEADFEVQNQRSLMDTQLAAFARLTFFLRLIAASVATVCCLGIFGLAWITAANRKRDIGACRAIGATATDVLAQFFFEGITGPMVGCVCGIVASWPVLHFIDTKAGQPFLYSPSQAMQAALISILLYTAAILASCSRAIRIAPSTALRAE